MQNQRPIRFVGFKRIFTVLKHPELKTVDDFEFFRHHLRTFIAIAELKEKIPFSLSNLRSLVYSRLFKKPLIHAIGDSHSNLFRYDLRFVVHHLGPSTMFAINKRNSVTRSYEQVVAILNRLDPALDRVMFVLGEIDARVHIYNQYLKNNQEVPITTLIERAIANFSEVTDMAANRGLKICVHGIPPARLQGNYYNFEHYASREMFGQIFKEYDRCLRKFCQSHGYPYLDVYSKFSDQEGFAKPEFMADALHLKPEAAKLLSGEIDDFLAAPRAT